MYVHTNVGIHYYDFRHKKQTTLCYHLTLSACSEVEISQFSYPVYYAFLKYLYTDKLDDLSSEQVVGEQTTLPVLQCSPRN